MEKREKRRNSRSKNNPLLGPMFDIHPMNISPHSPASDTTSTTQSYIKHSLLSSELISRFIPTHTCSLILYPRPMSYSLLRHSWLPLHPITHVPQQSLCAEMAEELCFAMRCRGSRQRPALKRQCTRCVPGVTYVPTGLEVPQINGNGVGGPGLSCGKAAAPLIASQ